MEENQTYKINTYCTNCDFSGMLDIQKGSLVEDATCPKCGNRTIEREHNVDLSTPSNGNNGYEY